jgi:hypothetical protein
VCGVNAAEKQLAEVDLKATLLDLDEADPFVLEWRTEEVTRPTEPNVAVGARCMDLLPVRVLGCVKAPRELPP